MKAVQRQLSGGNVTGRFLPGLMIEMTLCLTIMYVSGVGALFSPALTGILTRYIRQVGSRVWRPAALATGDLLTFGQVGVLLGGVSGLLPSPLTSTWPR